MCICVCVRARVCLFVHLCVGVWVLVLVFGCVYEREREIERGKRISQYPVILMPKLKVIFPVYHLPKHDTAVKIEASKRIFPFLLFFPETK